MYSGRSLRSASYGRPAIAYTILQDMLGKEKFREVLQEYMDRWHGKHPSPYDFFFTFNDVYGENLNWFWKPWFFERGYPDLAINKIRTKDDGVEIEIQNSGSLPVPLALTVTFSDGHEQKIYKTAAIWQSGKNTHKINIDHDGKITGIKLGNNHIPDRFKENNTYPFD
jgi:aminopeptidase N